MVLCALAMLVLLASTAPAQEWKLAGSVMAGSGRPRAPQVSVQSSEKGKTIVTVKFSSYNLWECRHLSKMYTLPSFPGCGFMSPLGDPDTPVFTKILPVAAGETVTFESIECDWATQEAFGRWYPAQPPTSDIDKLGNLITNEKTYKRSDDIFKTTRVSLSNPRTIWKRTYISLTLIPFEYVPSEGKIRFLKEARIALRRFHSPKDGVTETDNVKKAHSGYLVITPERFLESLTPFLNFKRKQHPDLEVKTLEQIGATVEAIDKVIETAGSRGTRSILLVGHSSILPSKPYCSPFEDDKDPDCRDGDYVYRNHGNDAFPSYRVGRFPVVSESELDTVIAKTLRRWQNPGVFQTRPMLIAHEQDAPGKYQGCVQEIVESVIPHAKTKLEPRMVLPASPAKGGLNSRKEDFYAALKSGVGVMLYRGHGGTDFIATKYLDYWGSQQKQWYELKTAVPPVFYAIACLNGQMTDASGKRVFGLCENLLTSQSCGVSAAIGAIQPSPTIPNHTFAWNLMYYTYVEPQPCVGDVFMKATMATALHGFNNTEGTASWAWVADLYNLYGDPELPVTALKN